MNQTRAGEATSSKSMSLSHPQECIMRGWKSGAKLVSLTDTWILKMGNEHRTRTKLQCLLNSWIHSPVNGERKEENAYNCMPVAGPALDSGRCYSNRIHHDGATRRCRVECCCSLTVLSSRRERQTDGLCTAVGAISKVNARRRAAYHY